MRKPLAIDLFCGLGGWTEALLAEGWRVIGFDIERHDYGSGGYPGQLVLQDVRTIHGAQFKDADLIVASPPCQEFSYRAMPWKRAKALPPPVLGINLFWQCWRIQHEANEANICPKCNGRGYWFWPVHHFQEYGSDYEICGECCGGKKKRAYIPLVVENVKGAQPWVGRAAWHYGSFYLWGDVPALMPRALAQRKGLGRTWFGVSHGQSFDWREQNPRDAAHIREGIKQAGLSGAAWFNDGVASVSSRSDARKAASAQIAKIPEPLARHIAQVFKPRAVEVCA